MAGLLLALLFTPLRNLWPLVIVVVGALTLTGRMRSGRALLWAGVALAGGLFSASPWAEFTPRFSRGTPVGEAQTLNLEGIRVLEARSFNGFIKLTVAPGEPRLEVRRRGQASVIVQQSGETLSIEARRPFLNLNAGADLELRVPEGLEFRLETSNGPVQTTGLARSLSAKTSNDPIIVRKAGQTDLKLETSNGLIEVSNVSGSVKATTSNAGIKLLDATNIRTQLQTSNGPIDLERVSLQPGTENRLESSNAPIHVATIHAPAGLVIRGETSNDPIDAQLPGYAIQLEGSKLEAKREGDNMTNLGLFTSNAPIIIRP
jgi:hypothetical protein